jgi:hypothetical protein
MKEREYVCIPAQKGKRPLILCIALLVFSVFSFYWGTLFPQGRAVGQLLAVLFLLLFIQLTNKYLLTEYRYEWREGTLTLSKRQGKRIRFLGSIELKEGYLFLSKKEWKETKDRYPLKNRFSYCRNMATGDASVLLCPDGEKYLLLLFEPDATLCQILREYLEKK